MGSIPQKITGTSFHKMNFRDFCRRFACAALSRIKSAGGFSGLEQTLVSIAFAVIKITNRDFRQTNRLDDFEDLLMIQGNWDLAPRPHNPQDFALGRAETSSYHRFRFGVSSSTRFFTTLPKSIAINPAISAILKSSPAT